MSRLIRFLPALACPGAMALCMHGILGRCDAPTAGDRS